MRWPGRSAGAPGATPQGRGRVPGFDVLGEVLRWDEVTAGVVLRPRGPARPLRFFTEDEEAAATALFDRLLDQDGEPRVPVLWMVDERLTKNETDGWHYADMPPDREAWHRTLCHLDDDALERFDRHFGELGIDEQGALVQAVQDLSGDDWHGLPAKHVWSLWTRYAATAFYAHPWAWNEIGFGGPAYPRGYKNLGVDAREGWEVPERDGLDPVPWGERKEAAQRRHAETVVGSRPKDAGKGAGR